jgi:diacylglycerol kinase (ATP)
MNRRIRVIINPAAGQDRPILVVLNRVFHPAGVDWDVCVTKRAGDAREYAKQAVQAGVDAVGVYGGDGTVMEVASGLIGSDIPLANFPGGTANVMSVELAIPNDLAEASALVCGDSCGSRWIDMGQVSARVLPHAVRVIVPSVGDG